jgi:hypothetical protein
MALRRTPLAILLSPMLVLVGIGTIAKLLNGSAQTGDALVHVCSSITDLSVLAWLLLMVGVGVQFRKMGCVTFFRFVPWEAINGYEWRPFGSTGRLLLWLKPRASAAFLQTTARPAKKETIDRILMEHLPQSAHPPDADPLQTFDLTSRSERTPAERTSFPAFGLSGLMQVVGAFVLIVGVMGLPHNRPVAMFVFLLLGFATLCSGLIVLRGAWNMHKLKNYRLCRFSAVLAMLPLSCAFVTAGVIGFGADPLAMLFLLAILLLDLGFVFGLPLGIWALVVLRRADVRAAFARSA